MGLTDAFDSKTFTSTSPNSVTRFFSDNKDYIIGPTVELRLPLNLSVEADALYRPLSLKTQTGTSSTSFTSSYSTRVSTWEFPILAKYRLPIPLAKPYIDAGPSFRHVGQLGSRLSSTGFAVGGGVEFHLPLVRVSPELRYTRWADDSKPASGTFRPASNLNQAELLVGFSF